MLSCVIPAVGGAVGPDAGELSPITSRDQGAITNKRNSQQRCKYKKSASAYYSANIVFLSNLKRILSQIWTTKIGNISWSVELPV